MAAISESKASLRIAGDSLAPEEISHLLGRAPTLSYRKGDLHGADSQYRRRTGMWSLSASPRTPEDINDQIEEIFTQLTSDLDVWEKLSAQFEIDLFCGLFMQGSNEGISLSAKSLEILASRSVEIGFDIYSPLSDHPEGLEKINN